LLDLQASQEADNPSGRPAGCSSDDDALIADLRRSAKKRKAQKVHRAAAGLEGAIAGSQAQLPVEPSGGELQPAKHAFVEEEASQALHSNDPEENLSRESNKFMLSFHHRVSRISEATLWCYLAAAGLTSFTENNARIS
jgi:hypothetical protein